MIVVMNKMLINVPVCHNTMLLCTCIDNQVLILNTQEARTQGEKWCHRHGVWPSCRWCRDLAKLKMEALLASHCKVTNKHIHQLKLSQYKTYIMSAINQMHESLTDDARTVWQKVVEDMNSLEDIPTSATFQAYLKAGTSPTSIVGALLKMKKQNLLPQTILWSTTISH